MRSGIATVVVLVSVVGFIAGVNWLGAAAQRSYAETERLAAEHRRLQAERAYRAIPVYRPETKPALGQRDV